MSKVCKECGHQMDDDVQVCPNCGYPMENAKASVFMEEEVLNEGKSTEAESTISELADGILKWGNILAIFLPLLSIIKTLINSVSLFSNGYEGTAIITIIISIAFAVLSYYIIKCIAKLIWATIMLFVNISTTLKRIEIKIEENGTR